MRDLLRTHAALLFAGLASFILMGAGQSLYGPVLPAFSRAFDLEVSTVGLLVSSHWVGCAVGVGAMFLAPTKITPRHVLAAMLAGAVLLAWGANFAIALAGGFFFGAGYGAATVVFNPRVLHAFGPRGPAMLSLMNAAFGIGAIAAPLVYVALSSNPAPTFAISAALIAGVWLLAGRAGENGATAAPIAAAPFAPHWPILIFHGLAIAIEACLIGLGPTALIRAGLSEVRAAELLSAFFIGFLVARLILTVIAHRLDVFTTGVAALIACGAASIYAATASPSAGFVVMGLCAGVFFPTIYVAASGTMRGHPRTAVAIIAAGMVGGIFAPLILSPLLPFMGDVGFFWAFGALALAMGTAGVALRSRLLGSVSSDPVA
ncbi:MAG: MFS transporter [Cypionkella sp.]|nr:MFS transporter [Cypionkella sp.]